MTRASPSGRHVRISTQGHSVPPETMKPVHLVRLLDIDCRFDDRDHYPGRQDDTKPGVHNSRWTPSHEYANAEDPARWPQLQAYVGDVVGAFGRDRRVLVWDLYNEPSGDLPTGSLPLVETAFRWARAADPRQPLTAGSFFWHDYMTEIRLCGERNSDVVSVATQRRAGAIGRVGGHGVAGASPRLQIRQPPAAVPGAQRGQLPVGPGGRPHPDVPALVHPLQRGAGARGTPVAARRDAPTAPCSTRQEAAVLCKHAGEDVALEPVPMTPKLVAHLEELGLIIRLRTGGHDLLAAQPGETLPPDSRSPQGDCQCAPVSAAVLTRKARPAKLWMRVVPDPWTAAATLAGSAPSTETGVEPTLALLPCLSNCLSRVKDRPIDM